MAGAMDKLTVEAPLGRGRRGKSRPQKKRPGAGRSGKPVRGASRNTPAVASRARKPSVWLNRLLILVAVGVVLVAAAQAWLTLQRIPVQRISVTGELEHTQAEVVQDLVQPSLAGGFLKADLQGIRRQLQGLPWIFEATVRRKWPNALEIHVVEQLPIARWGRDGFLNHEGEVFHSGKSGDWESLPLLLGPEGTAKALMAKYQRLVEMLASVNLSVEQLAVDERGQMEAVLAGGMKLIVGSDDFLGRMHRFVAIYRTELARRAEDVERVDLRYESGIAVAFSEPPRVAEL